MGYMSYEQRLRTSNMAGIKVLILACCFFGEVFSGIFYSEYVPSNSPYWVHWLSEECANDFLQCVPSIEHLPEAISLYDWPHKKTSDDWTEACNTDIDVKCLLNARSTTCGNTSSSDVSVIN